jgi:Uma2 family endonuclease
MGTTQAVITFEEFERMPDQPGKQELLRGELIELPPADLNHNEAAERIFERLKAALAEARDRGEAPYVGRVHHEMGYKLGACGWVQPDISITHTQQQRGKYYEGAPAIAIEVISPSNTAESVDTKTDLYFEFGAREVWRVYPKTRKIVIHVGKTASATTFDAITTPLIPGFSMSIDEILGHGV